MLKPKSLALPFLAAFVFSLAVFSSLPKSVATPQQSLGFSTESVVVEVTSIPKPTFQVVSPFDQNLSAENILVADLETLTPLYAKMATVSAEPASLSKLVTALVSLKMWPEDRSLIVPANCLGLGGESAGLVAGEVITLKNLLYGMLLNSGTDATCTVYSNAGGVTDFTAEMNDLVRSLGLTNTNFGNPVGFDQTTAWAGNITTAGDLAVIARQVLGTPLLREIVGTREIVVTSLDGGQTHPLKNTNELLGAVAGVYGVKTGTTDLAGQCLITATKYQDHDFLIVVLGSYDRFGDTRKLIKWLESNIKW